MNKEIDKIKNIVNKIDGWLTDKEGELLYELAKNCAGKGVVVEIGSWKGKSTIWLGKGTETGNKVKIYAIDPHTGAVEQKNQRGIKTFNEFKKNILEVGLGDLIIPIVKTSEKAALDFNKPVEFVFIDGSHDYDMVKSDFNFWFPKIINGGIMAFHDTNGRYGPTKIVEKMMYKSSQFINIKRVDSITYAKKVVKNSLKDRIKNRLLLFFKKIQLFPRLFPKYLKAKKIINLRSFKKIDYC